MPHYEEFSAFCQYENGFHFHIFLGQKKARPRSKADQDIFTYIMG
jgi:hypothetical protein